MDKKLLEILACPLCHGKLIYLPKEKALICQGDKLAYPIRDNIPVLLAEEARHMNDDEVM